MILDIKLISHVLYCTRHDPILEGTHCLDYDSYYCRECVRWLEDHCKCGGDDCKVFPNRPDKPLEE